MKNEFVQQVLSVKKISIEKPISALMYDALKNSPLPYKADLLHFAIPLNTLPNTLEYRQECERRSIALGKVIEAYIRDNHVTKKVKKTVKSSEGDPVSFYIQSDDFRDCNKVRETLSALEPRYVLKTANILFESMVGFENRLIFSSYERVILQLNQETPPILEPWFRALGEKYNCTCRIV